MELLGITLSVPAAFVCSAGYAWLLSTFVWQRLSIRRVVRVTSLAVLGLIVLEVVLLALLGAVRLRRISGPLFYAIHLALFFAAVPSLANLLVLRRERRGWRYILGVACVCAAFALPMVLLQCGVSEALFGVD